VFASKQVSVAILRTYACALFLFLKPQSLFLCIAARFWGKKFFLQVEAIKACCYFVWYCDLAIAYILHSCPSYVCVYIDTPVGLEPAQTNPAAQVPESSNYGQQQSSQVNYGAVSGANNYTPSRAAGLRCFSCAYANQATVLIELF
jgi:hypothetical protein